MDLEMLIGCKVKQAKKPEDDGVFCWRDFYKLFFHPIQDSLPHWPASPSDSRREVETIIKCFDDLPEGVVAMILAMLPASDIYHGRFVCKAWESIITTDLSFRSAFHKYVQRCPWFILLSTENLSSQLQSEAVFDMEAAAPRWRQLKLKIPIPTIAASTHKLVVSSGGLICAWSGGDSFIVCNPLTGSSHHLPSLPDSDGGHSVKGMAMLVSPYSESPGRPRYQVFVVILKKDGGLQMKSYSSKLMDQECGTWTELRMRMESSIHVWHTVRTAGVALGQEGQIYLYFVIGNGCKSVCCDINSGTVFMTPRFLPSLRSSKASELVVCNGSLFAVTLSRDIQQQLTQLQVYQYFSNECINDNAAKIWKHVTTMPANLSEKNVLNNIDHDHPISCAGYGNHIIVHVNCASSNFPIQSSYSLMFNIKEKDWVLLLPSLPGIQEFLSR